MTDRVDALARLLRTAARLSDWAAQTIVEIPYEPKRENLEAVVEAISKLADIERKIYAERPDLMPSHMRERAELVKNGPIYSRDNPIPKELRDKLEIGNAIEVLECLGTNGKNRILEAIARREIPKLKDKLDET